MAAPPPSIGEVERVARAVLGSPDVTVIEAQQGYGNQSWRILDGAGRAFVLKVGDPASAAKWRSANQALELAGQEGVPVPELVYDGHHDAHLVRVFTWVDGTNAKDRKLDEAQEHRFVASLGHAVAALHRVRLHHFSSRLDGTAPQFARWADYLAHRFTEIRVRCEATGAVPPAVVDRAASVLDGLATSIGTAA